MSLSGRIFQINLSNGGVPKQGVAAAEVTPLGLVGDRHNDTEHHGGPDKALCLYSLERILALQEEGHRVFPGAMGENVTLIGLDWSALTPGTRLRLGEAVEIEITGYTTPCHKIAGYFTPQDSSRVSQKRFPGWSRVYARVIHPGQIQVGDPVTID